MPLSRRHVLLSLTAAILSPAVHADSYPTKPVRLVVNFAPGGTSDVIARALAQPLSVALGQQVIVDNRVGAFGVVGATEVSRAPSDGYTLLLTTQGSLTEHPVLMKNIAYDPLSGLKPVTIVGEAPMLFFANAAFPANNIRELIAYSKAQPDGVSVSVSGSTGRLGVLAFAGATGANLTQIPYTGLGPALNAAIAGHTPVGFNTSTTTLLQQVTAGKLKILGVSTAQPSPLVPGVAPIAESAPGYQVTAWYGIFVPGKTPQAVITKLSEAFHKAMQDPSVVKTYQANSMMPRKSSPAELAREVESGLARTRDLARRYGIQAE